MLCKEMEKAVNSQINFELYSSYIYLGMAGRLEELGFPGAAHWMRMQAKEELFHAMKFFDYVIERDGKVELEAIEKPSGDWENMLHIFEHAFKHEKVVTARICKLVDLALEEKDHITNNMLQWFINEQLEEEKNAKTITDQIRISIDSPQGLFMIDRELAARPEPTPPAQE